MPSNNISNSSPPLPFVSPRALFSQKMGHDQDPSSSDLQLVLGLALTASGSGTGTGTGTTAEETITTATTTAAATTTLSSSTKADDYFSVRPTPTKLYSSNFITACSEAEPSLTLGLSGESNYLQRVVRQNKMDGIGIGNKVIYCEEAVDLSRQTSPQSGVCSSFSSGRVVKRERDLSSEEVEAEAPARVSSRVSDEDEDGTNARKKLRLTKEQSALLEESFKLHSTLNPKQKQALARQLNLRPRQVEVWFQNRRARTKLKQTEVDCEFLKKCCETLTDENRRLKKELQELKALKLAQPLYMPMPAATLTMCPSCERLGGVGDGGSSKSSFSLAPKPHFYNPFANPSAAC